MPSANDILRTTTYLAQHYITVAIAWHLLLYFFLLMVLLGKNKPSNRIVGLFLTIPLLSVSFFAWQVSNPFNGVSFLMIGMALFYLSIHAKPERLVLNPSLSLKITGAGMLLFGLVYPHFLGQQLVVYLYASPTGIIPCPTLLMITGVNLIFLSQQSSKSLIVLLVADMFYGLFGIFKLHVYLDILLVIGSIALFVQLMLQRNLLKNLDEKSLARHRSLRSTLMRVFLMLPFFFVSAYPIYSWFCRLSANKEERRIALPSDQLIQHATAGYTLGIIIGPSASQIWPWLIQMGQGSGGFYTHQWLENILRANIQNANSIIPQFQTPLSGDTIWLTPNPYLGKQGQHLIMSQIDPPRAIVYKQISPNGFAGACSFMLEEQTANCTRLLFMRGGSHHPVFGPVAKPGYYFMDNGMLSGIKHRSEFSNTNFRRGNSGNMSGR